MIYNLTQVCVFYTQTVIVQPIDLVSAILEPHFSLKKLFAFFFTLGKNMGGELGTPGEKYALLEHRA